MAFANLINKKKNILLVHLITSYSIFWPKDTVVVAMAFFFHLKGHTVSKKNQRGLDYRPIKAPNRLSLRSKLISLIVTSTHPSPLQRHIFYWVVKAGN